jgi:hypothetical protein
MTVLQAARPALAVGVLALAVPALGGGPQALEVDLGPDARGLGQGAAVDDEPERIEQEEEAGAPGVDHAGLLEHRQHVGGAGQGIGRHLVGPLHDVEQGGLGPHRRRSLGRGRSHREDGPLDRADHGPAGQIGRMGQGVLQLGGPHAVVAGGPEALAHAPQELAEDDPGIPPGPHEGAVPDGLADLGQHGVGGHAVQLGDHGFQGQGHVGAGVAVGHRVDVEAVDVHLVRAQGVPVALHHGTQLGGAQGRPGGHGRGC